MKYLDRRIHEAVLPGYGGVVLHRDPKEGTQIEFPSMASAAGWVEMAADVAVMHGQKLPYTDVTIVRYDKETPFGGPVVINVSPEES